MAIGLVAVAAASPVAAIDRSTSKISVDPLVYFYRQLLWVGLGVPIMLGISMLPKAKARRWAVVMAVIFTFCLLLVPVLGSSINGAKRWIDLPGIGFSHLNSSSRYSLSRWHGCYLCVNASLICR